jgi:nucleotide-binding universal stress UspA family protein
MRKILVPTDFSEMGGHALQYGIAFTNRMGGRLELLHSYETPTSTGMLISVEPMIKDNAESDMKKLVSAVGSNLTHDSTLTTTILKGDPVNTILKMAKDLNFDLIIMGTQGSSAVMEVFLGSTTVAVMKKSLVPVLAIPPDAKYQSIKKIVFAIDSSGFSQDIFEPLRKISEIYHAHIYVFHVAESPQDIEYPIELETYLKSCSYSYHSTVDDQIFSCIHSFTSEVGADLLAMVKRERGFFQSLFYTSKTKRELFNSKIPLLIFRDK